MIMQDNIVIFFRWSLKEKNEKMFWLLGGFSK